MRDAGGAGGDGDDPERAGGPAGILAGAAGAVSAEAAAETAPVSALSVTSVASAVSPLPVDASGAPASSAGAGSSPRISAAAAAASPAERSAAVNSAFISCRASEERIVRWASSAPAGAAIRKIRSAGPSAAPKSTPAALRPKASVGSVTCSLRQCADADAAVEAGRHLRLAGGHVGEEALQVGHPAQGHHPLREGTRRRFLGVGGQVEVDQVRGDHVAHRGLASSRIARNVG
ncbi:hypothetical protein SVIOM342S_03267 [Streptomyces violaceorubidus]